MVGYTFRFCFPQNYKNILNGEIIKSNHPAKGGHSEGEKDFLKGDFFEKTKDIINWLGIKEII